MNKEERIQNFLNKAKIIHKNKYKYDKMNYINANTKITIICPIHGEFQQTPHHHLEGHGCKLCANIKTKQHKVMTKQNFVNKANEIHNYKYNYDKSIYKNARTNILITCPKHGDFEQLPCHHLKGHGCPKCKISKGENLVKLILDKYKINYKQQYKINIDSDINPSGRAYIDFYLPDYNIFIEYNGEQHYIQREFFGGAMQFNKQKARDLFIKKYSEINNMKLIEISYKLKTEESILKYLNEHAAEIFII